MSEKTDIIKRQSPDIWKWAGTRISKVICAEHLIDDYIQYENQQITNNRRELLDVHVYKWYDGGFKMANIDFLTKPKQHGE
ncbi:hypothetical protein ABDH65_05225 [Heyndrickxia ginsengihumi]|uniref:hypothetical protein n=1 Tax=Heyndrickxia ginsengihumi TaxID=363870 RepID=UPI003D203DF4